MSAPRSALPTSFHPHNISPLWPTGAILFGILVVGARSTLVGLHARGVLHLGRQRCAGRIPPLCGPVSGRRAHRSLHRRCRRPPVRRWFRGIRQPPKPHRLSPRGGGPRPSHVRIRGSLRRRRGELLVLLARVASVRGPRVSDAGTGDPDLDCRCPIGAPRVDPARHRGVADRRRAPRRQLPRLPLADGRARRHPRAGVSAVAAVAVGGDAIRPGRRQYVPPDPRLHSRSPALSAGSGRLRAVRHRTTCSRFSSS